MNTAPRPRRLLRSIGAVLAGLLTIVVLSTVVDQVLHATGVFPPAGRAMANWLWLLAAGYRFAFGILACHLTARLAPHRPMAHAMTLAIVGVVIGLIGVVVTWGSGAMFGPAWYGIAVMLMPLPCAWIGGRVKEPAAA